MFERQSFEKIYTTKTGKEAYVLHDTMPIPSVEYVKWLENRLLETAVSSQQAVDSIGDALALCTALARESATGLGCDLRKFDHYVNVAKDILKRNLR